MEERRKKDVKINHIDRRTFYKECKAFDSLSKEFKDSIVTNIIINKIVKSTIGGNKNGRLSKY